MTRIFTHDRHDSPVGRLHVVTDDDALVALDFEGFEARMMRLLARRFPGAVLQTGRAPRAVAKAIDAYFAGDLAALDGLPVKFGGTDFQRRVWTALRAIPAGKTTSYGALAERLGKPTASRAVGMANGANAIAIVVPCHRVIGANGDLTGYAGEISRKRFLLKHEGALAA